MQKPLLLFLDPAEFMMFWQVFLLGVLLVGAYVFFLVIRSLRKYLRKDNPRNS